MLLPPVRHYRPVSLADAIVAAAEPGAALLAGGQGLLTDMKLGRVAPRLLVEIGALTDLRGVARTGTGGVLIGAGNTLEQLAGSPLVRSTARLLAEVAATTADPQVRNRGTLGGNVCGADPAANLPPLLMALAAVLHVADPSGRRRVPATEFFSDPGRPPLGPGELLTAVEIGPPATDLRLAYRSLQLARDARAVARAVVALRIDGGVVADIRLVLGCLTRVPLRARAAERTLLRRPVTLEVIAAAARTIEAESPVSTVRASAVYRLAMARIQVARALRDVMGRDVMGDDR